jgi:hypothetical protein
MIALVTAPPTGAGVAITRKQTATEVAVYFFFLAAFLATFLAGAFLAAFFFAFGMLCRVMGLLFAIVWIPARARRKADQVRDQKGEEDEGAEIRLRQKADGGTRGTHIPGSPVSLTSWPPAGAHRPACIHIFNAREPPLREPMIGLRRRDVVRMGSSVLGR